MYVHPDGARAIIFANGAAPDLTLCRPLLDGADMVVAADGGARAALAAGVDVTAIIGDMDSAPPDLLARWRARGNGSDSNSGGEMITFPPEKDETDLELALSYVVARGARKIAVLGALGGRIDHELANLLLLATPPLHAPAHAIETVYLDSHARIVAVRNRVEFAGRQGDLLSLLPISTDVDGIVTEGLQYPLRGESLRLGPARGVSNVFLTAYVSISVAAGILLAIHTWPDDRPLTW